MSNETPVLSMGDLRLFWTAFDPLDLASDSIDPLGFMTGYIALADRLLPGLTTITTVPRYAAMLCKALASARAELGGGVGDATSSFRRQMVEKLKLFERAWALSCGFAESSEGTRATDGLRGIRAVHRYLAFVSGREKVSLGFELLSNQVRYGGIGAYGTFLESMHLADMNAMTLRPLGEELAEAFPSPEEFNLEVLKDDARLSVKSLWSWGEVAHPGTVSPAEAQCLRRALRGGEEAELDDQARWVMLRLIRNCAGEGVSEAELLSACLEFLEGGDASGIDIAGLAASRLQPALRVIEQYERIYQCATFVFDQMRVAATASGEAEIKHVADEQTVQQAHAAMRQCAAQFLSEVESASATNSLGPAAQSLQKLRIIDLATTVAAIDQPIEFCREILRRHNSVQQDKFDGGMPKGPWIRAEGGGDLARLSQQRFGLERSQAGGKWWEVDRHPYRTGGARRFIRQCGIRP